MTTIVATLVVSLAGAANAWPPGGNGNGNGGGGNGGGGGGPGYQILSLPSPNGDDNHYSVLKSISDLGPAGEVHVVGYHFYTGDEDRSYCWTVGADGNATIEDLSLWFWQRADLDVNSAGAICGETDALSPAVLLPDSTFVVLQEDHVRTRLNNPDDDGIFQVVGGPTMWDLDASGNILATTPLVDLNGVELYALDINDYEEIAGFISENNDPAGEPVPAMGYFVEGLLQIETFTNPNPDVIVGFADLQIDHAGNLLGHGFEPGTIGILARAVVWPAAGGAVDIVGEFPSLNTAHGNGIASVDGVMQVVGDAHANSGTFPSLYVNGQLLDLNQLAEGDEPWEVQGVAGINSAGVMCAHGRVGKRRNYRAESCLLVPVN